MIYYKEKKYQYSHQLSQNVDTFNQALKKINQYSQEIISANLRTVQRLRELSTNHEQQLNLLINIEQKIVELSNYIIFKADNYAYQGSELYSLHSALRKFLLLITEFIP